MDHIPILILFTFALSETLLVHVKPSLNTDKHLNIVEVANSLRKLHKRQVEDFGNRGPPDVEGGGNKTGDRPWDKRGGGRRRHRSGNHGNQGCNFRGRRHKRPSTNETGETSLEEQTDDRGARSLVTKLGFNKISNHRGKRRFNRRGSEECKEDGIGGNATSTSEPPNDD